MPKCGKCGGNLGGRGYKSCRSCNSKHGKRKSTISRHTNHTKGKRARKNTVNPWQLHNATGGHADAPPPPPPLPTCCANCTFLFNDIKTKLDSAKRSAAEGARCRKKGAAKVNQWNFGRLKDILQHHMLILDGGAYKQQLCSKCLQIKFGVGRSWGRRFFQRCVAKTQSTEMTKAQIVADTSFDLDRVIIPFTVSTTSKRTSLESLNDEDIVTLFVRRVEALQQRRRWFYRHRPLSRAGGLKNIEKNFFFLRFFASQQKSKKYKNYFFLTRVLDVCIGMYCF